MLISDFQNEVYQAFRFLCQDFGFTKTEPNEPYPGSSVIEYAKGDVSVIIASIAADGGGVEVLLRHATCGELSFHVYLRLVSSELAKQFGYSLAANDDEISELINMYADALKRFGAPLLENDRREFERLRKAEQEGEGLDFDYKPAHRFVTGRPDTLE